MNKQTLIGGVLVLVVAGIVFKTSHKSISGESEEVGISKDIADQGLAIPIVRTEVNQEQAPATKPSEGDGDTNVLSGPPHVEELKQYRAIKNKAFLTEEEKALRKSFLQDNQMLRNLGSFLKSPTPDDSDFEETKNVATDLLLEAIRVEKSSAAEAVLQDIVTDGAIENSKMDPALRESLAGVKAEILYHWSALDPEKVPQIEAWLPGPISKKIWQNVLKAQNQNRAESLKSISK